MARVTVYVPDQLKTRMDACPDSVNWSAEAQTAFEHAVARAEASMIGTDEKAQAIARLRAGKAKYIDEQKTSGIEDGRDWALKRADYDELRHLDALEFGQGDDSGFQWLVEKYMNDEFGYDFWEESVGLERRETRSDEWVEGFLEGALEAFRSVEAEL